MKQTKTAHVITEGIELEFVDPQGESTALEADLVFDPADPFAVTMVFRTGVQEVRWTFGRELESAMGSLRYLWLYAVSVLAAAATQLVAVSFGDPVPTVGASGGLFGLLAAYAILFPRRKLILLFPPILLPAPVFVLLYAAFELYAGVTGTLAGVAHFAHLGGLVGGLLVLRGRRRFSRR